MNRGLSIMLMVSILFAGGYFYYTAEAVCKVPISYRIGAVAPEFGLSYEEVRAAVTDAEALWEDATGRNLFSFDEGADFSINFVYDGRQAETNAEHVLREELEDRKDISDDVKEQYEQLTIEYEGLKDAYDKKVAAYDARLRAHNAEVADWNTKGGAPEEVYESLNVRQGELAREQKELNTTAYQLNRLVEEINNLGEKGNVLVNAYNNVVENYNDRFDTEQEFTQGDYQGTFINIYQYDSYDELQVVLAHELGHALSIDHVPGEDSVMYHYMEAQEFGKGLSPEDLAGFQSTCGQTTLTKLSDLQRTVGGLFTGW